MMIQGTSTSSCNFNNHWIINNQLKWSDIYALFEKIYKLIFYLKWNCNVWEKIRRASVGPVSSKIRAVQVIETWSGWRQKRPQKQQSTSFAYCLTRPGSSEVFSIHFSFPNLVSSYFFQTLQPNSTSILIRVFFFLNIVILNCRYYN